MLKRLLSYLQARPRQTVEKPLTREAATPASKGDKEPKPTHTFSPDAPISTPEEDRFQRWPFAERVAHTLAVRPDPSSLVVGIYGPWGDGKTSTLRMMERALKKHAGVAVANFNPWQFDSEQLLLKAFFASLAETLGKSLPTKKEEIGAALAKYGFLLSPVGGGEVAKGIGEVLSTVGLNEERLRIEKLLNEAGLRVIVMIDDIDRLDRREIQTILRLVKLTAGFQHVSYVLAFDDEVVAAALGERYGGGDVASGRRFLEKIVQVPLHLPPADSAELRRLAFEGVEQALAQSGISLTEDQVNAFVRHFVDGLGFELKTPRKAKLYGNALLFALPLLRGECNAVDLMLIEGIRVYYPKLYAAIRDNPAVFIPRASESTGRDDARRKQLDDLVNKALESHPPKQRDTVRSRLLEVLFPRLSSMGYGSDWDSIWFKEQRVCSSEYFARYFTYGVPRHDVSDQAVEEFLELILKGLDKATEKLRTYSKNGAMRQLIRKFRDRVDVLPPESCLALAMILARNGDLLPREKEPLMNDWTFMQAAILVAELLRKLPTQEERITRSTEIMAGSTPLPFAFEYLRWLRVDDPEREAKRVVPKETEDELGKLLADRIEKEAATAPLYRTFGGDTPALLWAWNKFGDPSKVSEHLAQSFERGKDEVLAFLASYIGLSWGMESGLPHKSDLRRDTYDAVSKLIAPGLIIEKLRVLYWAAVDNPEYHHGRDVPFEKRLALQFAHIHRQVAAPKAEPASSPETVG